MPEIFAQRRRIVDLTLATAPDIRLGDQRECQSGGEQRLANSLEVAEQRTRAGAARHHHKIGDPLPLVRCHVEQIAAFRFAPYSADRMARIGERRQGQRAVSRCKANPARDQGQVEQAERNAIPRRHLADVAASDVARPSAVGWLGLLPEVEDLSTDESDRDYHAKQERPRPRPDTAVERIAEEDRDAEHERQIEGGHDEACHGEAAERHALPSARDEGNEDDAGNPAAERHDPEQIALEQVGEIAHPIVDCKAAEPRQMPRACADPVQSKVARHHAAIDAQRHEPDRHDVVDDDIRPEDDGKVLVREWQEQQRKKLRQPRIVVRRQMQQG